jgi:hypothetical protein
MQFVCMYTEMVFTGAVSLIKPTTTTYTAATTTTTTTTTATTIATTITTTNITTDRLWSSGQSSWLLNQRFVFDFRRYQIFWEVVGLERGPLSLVSTTEELTEWRVAEK